MMIQKNFFLYIKKKYYLQKREQNNIEFEERKENFIFFPSFITFLFSSLEKLW